MGGAQNLPSITENQYRISRVEKNLTINAIDLTNKDTEMKSNIS